MRPVRFPVVRALVMAGVLASTLSAAAGARAALVSAQMASPAQIAHGRQLAQTCAGCHGADGNSASAQFPKLAGQAPEYLERELRRFKAEPGKQPERVNPMMNGIVAGLSVQDMQDLAAYFAAQPQHPGEASDAKWAARGAQIWRGGISDRRVPACAACHGADGLGMPPQYPRLSGQWSAYLEAQLQAFANGARDPQGPMRDIASRMTERQIRDVSDFAAGLR